MALRSFSLSEVFPVKMVTFGPLWLPERPRSRSIYVIMMYFSSIKRFRVVWSFSMHDLRHFVISASGCLIFGYSEVLTLDVCGGLNMSSPEFRRS